MQTVQCSGITKKGKRCSKKSTNEYCHLHKPKEEIIPEIIPETCDMSSETTTTLIPVIKKSFNILDNINKLPNDIVNSLKDYLYKAEIFPFGKYRGKYIRDICRKDPRYCEFIKNSILNFSDNGAWGDWENRVDYHLYISVYLNTRNDLDDYGPERFPLGKYKGKFVKDVYLTDPKYCEFIKEKYYSDNLYWENASRITSEIIRLEEDQPEEEEEKGEIIRLKIDEKDEIEENESDLFIEVKPKENLAPEIDDDIIFNFGKYSGQRVLDVYNEDRRYCQWVLNNCINIDDAIMFKLRNLFKC